MHMVKGAESLREDVETNVALVINPRENAFPIGKPGSPVLAWGLCILAVASSVTTFLAFLYV